VVIVVERCDGPRRLHDSDDDELCENMASSTKPKVHNVLSESEADRATITGIARAKIS